MKDMELNREELKYLKLLAKIYNIDSKEYDIVKWSELENVRYFYEFFKMHEDEFGQ